MEKETAACRRNNGNESRTMSRSRWPKVYRQGPFCVNCPRRAKPRLRDMSKSSHYINNRQPITGSLSKVLSKLAVEVRVDGEDETDLT